MVAHMKKLSCLSVVLCAVALFVAGCSGGQGINRQAYVDQKDTRAEKLSQVAVASAAKAGPSSGHSDYKVGTDDLLEISIFGSDEMKRAARVSAQGYISLPLVGKVKVSGKTTAELEKDLADKFNKFYVEPTVGVYVLEYRSARIGVVGAVKSPQVFAVTGSKSFLEMLGMAGGLGPDAGSTAYVMRPNEEDDSVQTITVNLEQLLDKANMAMNIPVYGGDTIHVLKGGVVYVDGQVEKPGAYAVTPNTNIGKAIAMAGGLKFEGSKGSIKLYRDQGNGPEEIAEVDYDAVKSGSANDVVIKEGDIVYVPTNAFKSVVSAIGNLIRGSISMGVTK